MIVIKPLSAVKIGNAISRLTVGQPVPEIVIEFWKKNKMFDTLRDSGFIGKDVNVKDTVKMETESKQENKSQNNNNNNQEQDKNKKVKDESLFSNEKR
jgi:hypothetical protein